MSTSTLSTLFSSAIDSFWGYITAIFSPLVVFGIAFALVSGIVFLIWRRSHFTNK